MFDEPPPHRAAAWRTVENQNNLNFLAKSEVKLVLEGVDVVGVIVRLDVAAVDLDVADVLVVVVSFVVVLGPML